MRAGQLSLVLAIALAAPAAWARARIFARCWENCWGDTWKTATSPRFSRAYEGGAESFRGIVKSQPDRPKG